MSLFYPVHSAASDALSMPEKCTHAGAGAQFERYLNRLQLPGADAPGVDQQLTPQQIRHLASNLLAALDRASMQALFSDTPGATELYPVPLFSTDMLMQLRVGNRPAAAAPVSRLPATALPQQSKVASSEPARSGMQAQAVDPSPLRGEGPFCDQIQAAARANGIDAELIMAVIQAESNFNPQAVSPVGAEGLMQLMPATAAELGVNDAFDPEQNIQAGSRYLKRLLDRYDGDVSLALAAYNWGMGNLERHPEQMPEETVQYVAKITGMLAQQA